MALLNILQWIVLYYILAYSQETNYVISIPWPTANIYIYIYIYYIFQVMYIIFYTHIIWYLPHLANIKIKLNANL